MFEEKGDSEKEEKERMLTILESQIRAKMMTQHQITAIENKVQNSE